MSDDLIAQLAVCSLLVLEGLLLAWWYRQTIVRPARLEAAQYRFFALRDKAIRFAINNPALKADPQWQVLYEVSNEAAKQRNVDRLMRTSIPKINAVLQKAGISVGYGTRQEPKVIPASASINIEDLPPIESLIVGGLIAVLETCYSMRRWLRVKHWLASRIGRLHAFFEASTDGYAEWLRLLNFIAINATGPRNVHGRFGSVIDREVSRHDRQSACEAI